MEQGEDRQSVMAGEALGVLSPVPCGLPGRAGPRRARLSFGLGAVLALVFSLILAIILPVQKAYADVSELDMSQWYAYDITNEGFQIALAANVRWNGYSISTVNFEVYSSDETSWKMTYVPNLNPFLAGHFEFTPPLPPGDYSMVVKVSGIPYPYDSRNNKHVVLGQSTTSFTISGSDEEGAGGGGAGTGDGAGEASSTGDGNGSGGESTGGEAEEGTSGTVQPGTEPGTGSSVTDGATNNTSQKTEGDSTKSEVDPPTQTAMPTTPMPATNIRRTTGVTDETAPIPTGLSMDEDRVVAADIALPDGGVQLLLDDYSSVEAEAAVGGVDLATAFSGTGSAASAEAAEYAPYAGALYKVSGGGSPAAAQAGSENGAGAAEQAVAAVSLFGIPPLWLALMVVFFGSLPFGIARRSAALRIGRAIRSRIGRA